MADINQDDIDKLLQDTLNGDGSEDKPIERQDTVAESGVASQDDIDALFASVVNDPVPDETESPSSAALDAKKDPPAEDAAGMVGQDDIDALFASLDSSKHDAPPSPTAAASQEEHDSPPPDHPEEAPGIGETDASDASSPPGATAPRPPAPADISAADETDADADADLDALLNSL
ncbi:MAG: hypothetical protein LBE84_03200, partial [Planctomycetota bacterium]|nr:hypothetical protein [Planctomycetota bacterium]